MRRGLVGTLLAVLVVALAPAAAGAAPLDAMLARKLAAAGGLAGGYVLDTTTGRELAAVRADVPLVPASVNKLYTTSTALLRFGASATLTTTVLGTGALDRAGTWHGSLYLRGGGDPTFGSATFTRRTFGAGGTTAALADGLRVAGITRVTGAIYGDESRFDRLRGGPTTGFALDLTELGGPLGALLFNRGLAGEHTLAPQQRPAKFAARQLAAALSRHGIRVALERVGERRTPAAAVPLAVAPSPSIGTLARLTLVPSDNLLAETLLKDIGASFGAGGSTTAGVAVVRRTLARLGVRPAIIDGSGLSRANRTSARQVVTLLDALRERPGFRTALAVAGRTGTLAERMRRSSAQGRCRAKTGTLSDVSALAGYCRTPNGHLLAFAVIENGVWPLLAKRAEDRLAIALARQRPPGQPPLSPPPSSSAGGGASPASSP